MQTALALLGWAIILFLVAALEQSLEDIKGTSITHLEGASPFLASIATCLLLVGGWLFIRNLRRRP
jgi:hypothetical protein